MDYPSHFKVARQAATNEQIDHLLRQFNSTLPAAYVDFLRAANGAECGPNDAQGDALQILPSFEVADFNTDYGITADLPQLLCFASDGGDYAFAFDRSSSSDPDQWTILRKSLGSPLIGDTDEVAESFKVWASGGFVYPTT